MLSLLWLTSAVSGARSASAPVRSWAVRMNMRHLGAGRRESVHDEDVHEVNYGPAGFTQVSSYGEMPNLCFTHPCWGIQSQYSTRP